MQENVGRTDAWIRAGVGITLGVFGIRELVRGRVLLGAPLLVGGTMMVETAITRVCPIHRLVGIDTRRLGQSDEARGALEDQNETFDVRGDFDIDAPSFTESSDVAGGVDTRMTQGGVSPSSVR